VEFTVKSRFLVASRMESQFVMWEVICDGDDDCDPIHEENHANSSDKSSQT
jgi:hypothetical protein